MFKKKNILIVDDDVSFMESLGDSLSEREYQVTMVSDPLIALDMVKKKYFSLVITDFNMPKMNGLELYDKIKKFSPATIVILITASREDHLRKTLEEDDYIFLYKPFDVEQILEIVSGATHRPTILIADDQYEARESFKDLLVTKGFSVVTAENGEEASQIVERKKVDFVILDVHMPKKSGLETYKEIRSKVPHLPVVFVTGYSMEEYARKEIQESGGVVIQKPVDVEKVFSLIESCIEQGKKSSEKEKIKILLIDDDERILDSLKDILEDELIYEVYVARSGKETMDKIKEMKKCDIVITDFDLPDTNGLDLSKKIREIDDEIVFILLTGQASLDMAVRAIQSDIYDYLIKPADPTHLKKSIQKGLEKQRLSREIKNLLKELQNTNQQLSKMNEMQSMFFSMVNHDLRTPITVIKGFLELLMQKKRDQEEEKILRYCEITINQMGIMVNDLIDIASMEAGKFKMDMKLINLFSVLQNSLKGFVMLADPKSIELTFDIPGSDMKIMADEYRIMQVMTNLISNAVKFTPEKGKICLSAQIKETEIEISVKDSGPGISEECFEKIFDKFFQVKDKTQKNVGLGLGLFISKQIINQHGGKIWVTSEGIGKGTTFHFAIPVPISVRSI